MIAAGLWPPEARGEAVRASALAERLHERGHDVLVVTGNAGEATTGYTVRGVERHRSRLLQGARLTWLLSRHGFGAHVVYDVGLLGEAVVGAGLLHRPLVVKLAGDPAFARGRRLGLVAGRERDAGKLWGGAPGAALRTARSLAMRRAACVVCTSPWLAARARSWGIPERALALVPDPAPRVPPLRPRDELRESFGFTGPVIATAGRISEQKRLGRLIEALLHAPRATLVLAGEGPYAPVLRELAAELGLGRRVHFLGALPHKRLLELFRAADLAYQPASAGVFPNAALEALAVGRPVLTTTEPGSPELVRDGESGFVLAQPDALQLAGAIDRYIDDEKLRGRLELNASATALDYTPELTYSKMERVFAAASNEPA